jgi:hypothetical protein
VFINGYSASDARVAFGGVKKSGFGRELSHFGLHEFCNVQTVWKIACNSRCIYTRAGIIATRQFRRPLSFFCNGSVIFVS